jgi:hypothetical protein
MRRITLFSYAIAHLLPHRDLNRAPSIDFGRGAGIFKVTGNSQMCSRCGDQPFNQHN